MERYTLNEAKKSIKLLRKWQCQKRQRLTHFFNKQLYIHKKFVIKNWLNHHVFFIGEKNLQKCGLTAEVISVKSYYIYIFLFQGPFLVLQLVKLWLTVVNCVLIIVAQYLVTVKQC